MSWSCHCLVGQKIATHKHRTQSPQTLMAVPHASAIRDTLAIRWRHVLGYVGVKCCPSSWEALSDLCRLSMRWPELTPLLRSGATQSANTESLGHLTMLDKDHVWVCLDDDPCGQSTVPRTECIGHILLCLQRDFQHVPPMV